MSLRPFDGPCLCVAASAERISFAIAGPILREDLPGLCDRVCALFNSTSSAIAECDVSTVEPDAVTVEALALLQLGAHRNGCRVRLRNASSELAELIAFMGLEDVFIERSTRKLVAQE